MPDSYIHLKQLTYSGSDKTAELTFKAGVNVICGASDTGKSFIAESIDFMLGGSELREIPERDCYGSIQLKFDTGADASWLIERSTAGGDFRVSDLSNADNEDFDLKQKHSHGNNDSLSGFLLDNIDLLGKRILRNKKGDTNSLSFRNLARLVIVQENEIQQKGSPFWDGQYVLKTAELATIKTLLTGMDDSAVVKVGTAAPDNSNQVNLIDELLMELNAQIEDVDGDEKSLSAQLDRLNTSIAQLRENLNQKQLELNEKLLKRKAYLEDRGNIEGRVAEIAELLARFDLLKEHYQVDIERLTAIQESGSMFTHIPDAPCPLCGASVEAKHSADPCDGDVDAIVLAASSEISKIAKLREELSDTISELHTERTRLASKFTTVTEVLNQIDGEIKEAIAPIVHAQQSEFTSLIEKRSEIQKSIELYERASKLEKRKESMLNEEGDTTTQSQGIVTGIPDAIAHQFSLKISKILQAWDFPGDCQVHFDKETSDFVIDGKPRGSRGKGLRAITHAAVTIGLLEFCQENDLPHPGFVVLDSPLLAYFKPEGDDEQQLRGTNLKEHFYTYLIEHHSRNSQIIIIENQHPPEGVVDHTATIIFTGNPDEGRYGFL